MKTPDDTAGADTAIEIVRLDRAMLHASPTQPRKSFPKEKLEEIMESIIEHGVIMPLLLRPSKEVPGHFEIVAGECRYRSHGLALAKLADEGDQAAYDRVFLLPAMVRELSDKDVMELQLIENLQRTDLTPMEEADSYKRMLSLQDAETGEPAYTVETLAKKLGRDRQTIYKALKWANLPELARKAFELGIAGKELATLIARIPDEVDRRKATIELIFLANEIDWGYESIESEEELERLEKEAQKKLLEPAGIVPASVLMAREHIETRYMVSLKGAPFSLEDAEMVPEMGACMTCRFRTGSCPEFADELSAPSGKKKGDKATSGRTAGMDPLVCMRPSCRAEKVKAFADRQVKQLMADGASVLDWDEQKKSRAFYQDHDDRWEFRSGTDGYVELTDKPGWELVGHVNEAKLKTWEKMIPKDFEVHIALDPEGGCHRLINKDKAVLAINLAALKSGKPSPFEKAERPEHRPPKLERSVSDISESDLLQLMEKEHKKTEDRTAAVAKKKREEDRLEAELNYAAARELVDRIATKGLGIEEQRMVFKIALSHAGADGQFFMGKMLDIKLPKGGSGGRDYGPMIEKHVMESADTKAALEGWMVLAILSKYLKWRGVDGDDDFEMCAAAYGLKLADVRKRLKEAAAEVKVGSAGTRKGGKEALQTVTRGKSAARNQASIIAAESTSAKPSSVFDLDEVKSISDHSWNGECKAETAAPKPSGKAAKKPAKPPRAKKAAKKKAGGKKGRGKKK